MASTSFDPFEAPNEGNHLDFSSSLAQSKSGTQDTKPFSLPSLASITANLATGTAEQSHTGPHRKAYSLSISGRRRFSPLGSSIDYGYPVSPLESELSADGRSSVSGISMSIASGHRPRSHSLLSGHSVIGNFPESDAPVDESASDSGGSDKKHEDNDSSAQVKKRSRTLTTPSQQRRLMQILEKTRFPSTEVREQLARELGMTPRRVQIWFQNRRQGMKKALEQKTEQETSGSGSLMADFARPRGYSFGTYPPSADAFGQPGLHPLPEGKSATASLHGPNAGSGDLHNTSQSIDCLPQLYPSRSVSRGIPHGLAHLELSTTTSTNEPGRSSFGDLAWPDPSSAASLYCLPSAVGGEARLSPFAQTDQQYPSSGPTHHQAASVAGSRHRSQKNPDFFGMINGLIELPGLGRTTHDSIDPFQQITDGGSHLMAPNGRDQSLSINDGWSNTYIQSAPAWQEGLQNLKLDRHTYGLDPPIQPSFVGADPVYGNSACELPAPSSNYYYSGGIQENTASDSIASTPLHFNREDKYMGNYEYNSTLESDLAQHLRNRSHSLHF